MPPISLTADGVTYSQNFNSLSNTAASTTNLLPIDGWEMNETGGGTRDNERYAVDTGGSNTGDTFSYGAAGNADRALGSLQSGTLISTFGASFTNNTGATITSLDLAYFGEQWRIGNIAAARDDRIDFQISLNATSLTTGTWTDVNALDFTNTIKTAAAAAALDGNLAANRTSISHTITGLSIAPGETFWIRWNDLNASGADDGLAIDDFSLTVHTDVPVPPLPTLSIADVSVAEGNAGTTTYTFTVALSAPAPAGGVTFDIATADGTATTANGDYSANVLTGQTISAGSSTYTFNVVVDAGVAIEPDESFFVNVTNVVGATATDGQGQGTITNDDFPPTPTLTISDASAVEGDGGMTTFTFTVSLDIPAGPGGVTFDIATADSGATGGADFVSRSLTGQTIPAGASTYTFEVTVNGDLLEEANETFFVNVINITGAAGSDVQGVGTIQNDDFPPAASVIDASIVEGNEGVRSLVFTISLNEAGNGPVSVDYATAPGSATAGSDFLAVSGTLTFAVGETMKTVSVPIIGDDVAEPDEVLRLLLSNPVGLTLPAASANGTITNDDGSAYFSLAGGTFSQDWSNTGLITTIDNWSGVPFIIGYLGDIDSGSPADVDPRTLTRPDVGAVDVIANQINTNSTSGGVAEFQIANPTIGLQGSGTGDAPGIVLFMDSRGRTDVRIQANIRDVDGSADNAPQQVAVQYRTDPNGAWTNVPGGYIADASTGPSLATQTTTLDLLLPADAANSGTLQIRILTTNATGSDEWVGIDDIVVSSQPAATTSYAIADAAAFEGQAGTSPISFTVTRFGDTTDAGTVAYQVSFAPGAFQANPGDLTSPLSGTVSFFAGEVSKTVVLGISGDFAPEVDESFTIALSDPSAGDILGGVAVGTIVNDDPLPPLVSVADLVQAEGDGGTTLFTFTVTRTGGTGAFSVDYQAISGQAVEGQDFALTSGTLNFAAGELSRQVSVSVVGDTFGEAAETFQLVLSNPTDFAVLVDNAGTATIQNDDIVFIHDIQGTSYYSPILASDGIGAFNTASTTTVVIRAVVTAVDNDGIRQGVYLTEEYADWDSSMFTSEGIFVMTRSDTGVGSEVTSVAPGIQVGDIVTFTAQVMEYQAFSSMPRTILTNPTGFSIISSGNSLPVLLLDAGHPIPNGILTSVTPDYFDSADGQGDTFDASLYALSYWETVEGMLVTVPDVIVADGFVSVSGGQPIFQAYSAVHADPDQINSRGGLTIAGDPPLSPPDTAETDDNTIAGGRHLHDGDVNPDIIEIDFSGFAIDAPAGLTQSLSMGDSLGAVTGIVEFDFTDRKLFVTQVDPATFVDRQTVQETTLLGGDARSLTVGTFNVENLDPSDGSERFQAIAKVIAENLNAPDIISIEEIQDNDGATNSGNPDASLTWQMLVDALNAEIPGAHYQWVDQTPVNNQEGGEPGGNIRVGFLYNTNRVQLGDLPADATITERRQFTDRIGDGVRDAGDLIDFSDDMIAGQVTAGTWSGTRLSLLGQFTFNGNTVFVTANHFTAKGGSGEFWQIDQDLAGGEPNNSGWARRVEQAADVYAMLDVINQAAPQAGIVAGGDFNDFYFYRPLEVLTGYVLPDGSARVGGSRFDNLTLTLSEAERYTYAFDGRSQAIDHVVANQRLGAVATYDVVHLNTGFNNQGGEDLALSDHDPGLASFDYRSFSEVLTGTALSQTIEGFGGNDRISGGGGNDQIDGGLGTDIAVFGGSRADYQITLDGTGAILVEDIRSNSPDGTDSLMSVETLEFSDGAISAFANGAPQGAADATSAIEDGATGNLWTQLLANDTDVDLYDDGITIGSVDTSSTRGTVVFDPQTQTIRYQADTAVLDALATGATATDSFTYTPVDDQGLAGPPVLVTVTLTGINDAPIITTSAGEAEGLVVEAGAGTTGVPTASGQLSATDVDDGAALVWSGSADGVYGRFELGADGAWTYALDQAKADVLPQGEVVTETFTASVTDDQGAAVSQNIVISITGTNDAAVLSSANVAVPETNAVVTTGGQLAISDVDSPATFIAQAGTAGAYGTFTIAANGAWTYTASSAHNEFVDGQTYTDAFEVSSADGTKTNVTVNILGTNDAAVLSPATSNLTETDAVLSTSGTLGISDVDSPATFVVQAATAGSYGTFTIDESGAWTYTAYSAHNAFVAGQTYTDSFDVSSADGTKTNVTVNILGTNDAAVLSSATSNLTETNAVLSTSGTLSISDVDSPATFVAQAATAGSYGTFTIAASGAWTYTASSAHNAFVDGQTYTDSFDVFSADGTKTNVTVNILGTNDAAVLGSATSNLTETNAVLSTSGTLSISDVDSPSTFVAQAGTAGAYGTFTIDESGAWTYTASSAHNAFVDGQTYTDSFDVFSADGTKTNVTVNIVGTNDAAILSSANVVVPETNAVIMTGGVLTISDVDSPSAFQAQVGTAGSFGRFTIDAAGVWSYTTYTPLNELPADVVVSESFIVLAADGTPTSVTVTVDGTDDPAIAYSDVFVTDEATAVSGNVFFGNSITGDFDPDSPLAVGTVNGSATNVGQQIQLASGALLTVNPDGSLSYDPNGAFDALSSPFTGASNTSAFDSFFYGLEGGGVATVLIQVNGLSSAEDRLQGNGFDNRVTGNEDDDLFFLQQGGNDQAFGGTGSDGFYFGGAFTPADGVDGGTGIDSLALQGNYAGLSLGSVSNVELLVLLSGKDTRFGDTAGNLYDYQVATTDANVPAGGIFTVQAETLLPGEDLKFDGSAETDGHFRIFAGEGNDELTGGGGSDGFFFGNGGNLDGNDRINGGTGTDSVALRGAYVGADAVVFDNASLNSVEALVFLSGLTREFGGTIFAAGFDYDVTMADGNVAAGQVMSVNGVGLASSESLRFDGRAETDGAFRIISGAGDDLLLGGQQVDTIYGGLGADQMDGQAGADVYVYRGTAESTAAAADRLTMDAADSIDLRAIDANAGAAGDQAFAFIGSGVFTGTAGELRATFSSGLWVIEGDTNGDGVADLFIQATSPDPITGSEFLF